MQLFLLELRYRMVSVSLVAVQETLKGLAPSKNSTAPSQEPQIFIAWVLWQLISDCSPLDSSCLSFMRASASYYDSLEPDIVLESTTCTTDEESSLLSALLVKGVLQ